VAGRRGRRIKLLTDNLKKKTGYCKLKEEALDRTVWRNGCGRGCGLFVSQYCRMNEGMNEWMREWMVIKTLLATMGNKVYLMKKITSYFNTYHMSTRQGPNPDKNLQLFVKIADVNLNVLLRPVTLGNLRIPVTRIGVTAALAPFLRPHR